MKLQNRKFTAAAALTLASSLLSVAANAAYEEDEIKFKLVRSPIKPASCLPYAKGQVKVTNQGNVEVMEVRVEGLPKNTEFDAFVIQVPNFPFGMSWYQGDIQTNQYGKAYARFVGRFNEETFIVAPKVAPAPQTHDDDAYNNPATAPVHTYHIGIWFNSPKDAIKAGCPGATTPFNGEHKAGVQILNTANFPDLEGPLLQLKP